MQKPLRWIMILDPNYTQSGEMQSNFRHWPHLIIMDTTHCANVRKLHINRLMVLDREKNGRGAAHALIRQETTDYYKLFLEISEITTLKNETGVFLIDKEAAEKNVIVEVFPKSHIHFCKLHGNRALYGKGSSMGLPEEKEEKVMGLVANLVECQKGFLY